MEIGAKYSFVDGALCLIAAVVAVTFDDLAEWSLIICQYCLTTVILVADHFTKASPGDDIADHTLVPCVGLDIKQADASDSLALIRLKEMAK